MKILTRMKVTVVAAVCALASSLSAADYQFVYTTYQGMKTIGHVAYVDDEEEPELEGDDTPGYTGTLPASLVIPDDVQLIAPQAFQDNEQLESVTIPGNVKYIAKQAFQDCWNLKSVTLSEGLLWVGAGAFENCPIDSICIPASLTSIDPSAFGDAGRFVVASGNKRFKVDSNGCLIKDGTMLCQVPSSFVGELVIPSNIKKIGEEAIGGRGGNLTSVVVPASVTQIEHEAFEHCWGLERVTFKGTRQSYDFENNFGNLKEIRVPWNFTGTIKGIPSDCKIVKVGLRELALKQTANSVGMKSLTGAGYYAEGKAATLRATAATGYAFAGWYQDEDGVTPCEFGATDYRSPTASWTMPEGESDVPVTLYAKFVSAAEDVESLAAHLSGETFTVDGAWTKALDVASGSLPTVKVTGLPKGLSFNAKTLTISGCPTTPGTYSVTVTLSNTSIKNKAEKFTIIVPNITSDRIHGLCEANMEYCYRPGVRDMGTELTKAVKVDEGYSLKVSGLPAGLSFNSKTGKIMGTAKKVGNYTVTFTATKKGAAPEISTRTIEVEALEMGAVGTFNGFLRASEAGEICGTFTLTATSLGKITAKVVNANGTYSFSGIWDSCEPTDALEGAGGTPNVLYKSSLRSSNGATLDIALDLSKAWNKPTLTGTFNGSMFVSAYENLLSEKCYLKATLGADGKTWNLTVPESASDATLTLTPKGGGTVTISGKIGVYSVSASSTLQLGEMSEGLLSADFVSFVKVGRVKKPLVIECALDMTRRTFGGDAGTAKILE